MYSLGRHGELGRNVDPSSCPWAPRPITPGQFLEDRPVPGHPAIDPPLLDNREGAVLAHREAAVRRWARSDNDSYPLASFHWRDNLSPNLTQRDEEYLDGSDVDCTVANIWAIAQRGDQLNRLGGEVGVSARQIRGINMAKRCRLIEGTSHIAQVGPSMVNRVVDYRSRGVIPVKPRNCTQGSTREGPPYKTRRRIDIVPKLRQDVREDRILIFSTSTIAEFDAIISTLQHSRRRHYQVEHCHRKCALFQTRG